MDIGSPDKRVINSAFYELEKYEIKNRENESLHKLP